MLHMYCVYTAKNLVNHWQYFVDNHWQLTTELQCTLSAGTERVICNVVSVVIELMQKNSK